MPNDQQYNLEERLKGLVSMLLEKIETQPRGRSKTPRFKSNWTRNVIIGSVALLGAIGITLGVILPRRPEPVYRHTPVVTQSTSQPQQPTQAISPQPSPTTTPHEVVATHPWEVYTSDGFVYSSKGASRVLLHSQGDFLAVSPDRTRVLIADLSYLVCGNRCNQPFFSRYNFFYIVNVDGSNGVENSDVVNIYLGEAEVEEIRENLSQIPKDLGVRWLNQEDLLTWLKGKTYSDVVFWEGLWQRPPSWENNHTIRFPIYTPDGFEDYVADVNTNNVIIRVGDVGGEY
ncbi:hypothetical protein DRJ48_05110 [Candidatus Woesearchaeota archaeon]|nr:MAG: hypothetical protein DRJ48_05110 [Candidatus Woesearchaeota archaeon]